MSADELELVCADEIEAAQDSYEFRDNCRDVVFLDEWRDYLEQQAWFDCLEELGLEGPLADPGEEHAECVAGTVETWESIDDLELSEECLDLANEMIEKAGDDYWECIHKWNDDHPEFRDPTP
jgi:hypothetical protein